MQEAVMDSEHVAEVVQIGAGPRKCGGALALFGEGGSVRIDTSHGAGNEWLRLNDLHQASGGEKDKQPSNWLRLDSTQALIAEHSSDLRNECFRVDRGGTDPGTWAHWVIAVAYAQWLSPAFHLRTINEWADYRSGRTHLPAMMARISGLESKLDALLSSYSSPALVQSSTILEHEHRQLVAEKRRVAQLGVRVKFWKSMHQAHRIIQQQLEESIGWGVKSKANLYAMPSALFPVAMRHLMAMRVQLERADAIQNPGPQKLDLFDLMKNR